MTNGNFLTGLTALMHWIGFLALPVLAAFGVCAGVYAYAKKGDYESKFQGALLCLMGPAVAALVATLVARTPSSGSQDGVYNAMLNIANYLGNVIMPLCAAVLVVKAILAYGGFHGQRGGDSAVRYLVAAMLFLMVSGIMRLLEWFVTNGAGGVIGHSAALSLGGVTQWV